MKRSYERPILKAEVFQVNAYCGACANQPAVSTNSFVTGDAYHSIYTINKNGTTASSSDLANLGFSTNHNFPKSTRKTVSSGYIYTCDCSGHDGTYFLEYSTFWSEYPKPYGNGVPTFFLYEDDGDGRFEPSNSQNGWPHKENGKDTAICMVTFEEGYAPVVNS